MWAGASNNDLAFSYLLQVGCKAQALHSPKEEGLQYTHLLISWQYDMEQSLRKRRKEEEKSS